MPCILPDSSLPAVVYIPASSIDLPVVLACPGCLLLCSKNAILALASVTFGNFKSDPSGASAAFLANRLLIILYCLISSGVTSHDWPTHRFSTQMA